MIPVKTFKLYRAAGDEGSTLVEFAIAAVVVLALLFGIIEMSWGLYAYTYVASAAREATRYAIVRGSQCTGMSECSETPHGASQTDITNFVHSLGYPNSQQLQVSASWPNTGTACYPIATPCNNPGNLVKVTVTDQFPIGVPFWTVTSLRLSSTSQMVISR